MKVRVRYFASLREALGSAEWLEVPPGSTLRSLRGQLVLRSARHAEVLAPERAVRSALDQRMCDEGELLSDGAEVAFFPPVTGG